MMPNPKKLSHKNPPQTQPATSSQLASTHGESGFPGKNVLFSIDRTFSASSEFYEDSDDQVTLQLKQYKSKEARRREFFEGAEKETNVGPSGFGDIEGNVIGQVDEFPFGQEEDDDDDEEEEDDDEADNIDDDENFEKQQHVHNKGDASSNDHHFHLTNSHTNNDSSSNNEDINNDADVKSGGGGRVHRKKSILRHVHEAKASGGGGGVSINSFNGSAASSSIISDGKMGSSMNGSFNSQFYNNFYSRAARRNDFQRYTRGPYAPLDRCNSTSASSAHSSTLTTHYYPEGGWGYVVLATALFSHSLLCGFLLCGGIFATKALDRFGHELRVESAFAKYCVLSDTANQRGAHPSRGLMWMIHYYTHCQAYHTSIWSHYANSCETKGWNNGENNDQT